MLHGFESQTQFSSGGRKKKSVYLSWSTNSSHSMSISFQHHNFYGKRPNLKLKFHIAEHFGVLLGIGVENDVNLCYSTVLSALLQKCQISSVINLEMQVPLRVTSPPPLPLPRKTFLQPIELNSRLIFHMIIYTSWRLQNCGPLMVEPKPARLVEAIIQNHFPAWTKTLLIWLRKTHNWKNS